MPHFNSPPGWPTPPTGWTPPAGWRPDPAWPAPPADHVWWVDDVAVPGQRGPSPAVAPAGMQVPALVPDEPEDLALVPVLVGSGATGVAHAPAAPGSARRVDDPTRPDLESEWELYHRPRPEEAPLPVPGAAGWAETVVGPGGTVTFVPQQHDPTGRAGTTEPADDVASAPPTSPPDPTGSAGPTGTGLPPAPSGAPPARLGAPPPFGPPATPPAAQLRRMQERAAARRAMVLGAVLLVVGLAATALTYVFAEPGGRYLVLWGPVVLGAVQLVRGIVAHNRA